MSTTHCSLMGPGFVTNRSILTYQSLDTAKYILNLKDNTSLFFTRHAEFWWINRKYNEQIKDVYVLLMEMIQCGSADYATINYLDMNVCIEQSIVIHRYILGVEKVREWEVLLPGNNKKIWRNHGNSVNGIWREIFS